MDDKISVVICNQYKLELKSVLSQDGFENFISIQAQASRKDPACCDHSEKFIGNLLKKNKSTHIISGSCLSITKKEFREYGGIDLYKANQCHYFLASEAIVDGLQNQGAYIVSPGWLVSWKKKIDFWGFDQPTAREFFKETTLKIVLLDTGVCESCGEDLKNFAEYLDLPYETLCVGLDHFKLYLKNLMHKMKPRSAHDKAEMIKQSDEAANYAMAMEIVSQLSESKSAADTIQQTIDLFTMLFSPEHIIFHSMTESIPFNPELFQFEGATCLTNNGQGFFVKISFEGVTYGVLEIINVAHPQYLKAYINLTMNLIGVVSLAIKEATYKEKLLETTEQLEWELAVNAALSEISSGLINQDNDLEYLTHLILKEALKLTGSQHGFVSVVDEKTGHNIGYTLTKMMGSSCNIEGKDRKIAFSISEEGTYKSLSGHALNIKTGFFTNDPARHQEAKGIPQGYVEIEKFLSVPAMTGEKRVGQIALANPGRDYSDIDLQAIKRLANLYSLAIEQKKTEDKLKLHSEIMNNMAEGVYLIGADDGLIKYTNPKFENLFGYGSGEMIGQHVSILNAPTKNDPLETANKIMKILNEKGVWHGAIENKKKDGTHFLCDANVSVFNHQRYGRVLVAVHSDITQRKKNEEKLNALAANLESQKKQLELLAATDSLTGLLNRRSFIERIESEIIRQGRSGKTFAVVMGDIDNFKNLNDSYGHPFGDSILIKVADILRENIRDQDSVSRWGGEEFLLLLPETDLKGASVLAEKIRKNLENSENSFEGQKITVTATFGISECQPQDNYLESIKKADHALYEGKKAGRNCIMPGHKI